MGIKYAKSRAAARAARPTLPDVFVSALACAAVVLAAGAVLVPVAPVAAPPFEPDLPGSLLLALSAAPGWVSRARRWPWLPLLVFVAGVAASLHLSQLLREDRREDVRQEVRWQAYSARNEIGSRLEAHILALVRIGERWRHLGEPSRREWEFVADLNVSHYKGFLALGWIDPSYRMQWVAPTAGNEAVLAMGTVSETRRRAALDAAFDDRTAVITAPLDLVQDGHGFVVYVPLFTEDRFEGWLSGAFRSPDVFDAMLKGGLAPGYQVLIRDGNEEIYRRHAADTEVWAEEKELALYGRNWVVRVWPLPDTLAKLKSPTPTLALISGLLLTFLLTLATWVTRTARLRAGQLARMNDMLRAEIGERERTERALQQAELHYRELVEWVRVIVWRADAESLRFTFVSQEAQAVLGYPPQRWTGDPGFWERHLHPDDRAQAIALVREEIAQRRAHQLEYRMVAADGRFVWFRHIARVVAERGAKETIGVLVDVTERKQAEEALQRQTAMTRLLEAVAAAANQAGGVEAAAQIGCERVCEVTGWQGGHLYLVQREGDAARLVSSPVWHFEAADRMQALREATEGSDFLSGVGLPGRVLESAKPEWVDFTQRRAPRSLVALDAGIEAGFAFPLLSQREVVGVLEFYSRERTPPDEALREVMAQVGTQLGRVIERQRAEEALRGSELRFRSVTESATDAIVSADSGGAIISWNQGAESMFGYRREEIIGKSFTLLLPPSERALHERTIERLIKMRSWVPSGRAFEQRGVRKDGSEFPLEISLATWQANGDTFYSGVIRNITERKMAEEALRTSERQLAAAQALAHIGNWEWDVATDVVSWSDELYRIYGLEPRSVPVNYESYLGHVHPDDREWVQADLERVFRECSYFKKDYRIVRRDGSVRVLHTEGQCIADETGKPARLYGVCQDVTERKRIEEEIRQLNEELEQRVAARTAELARANRELEAEIEERRRAEEDVRRRVRQQSVVARIGQLALSGWMPWDLMDEAVELAAAALEVEYCKVLELLPEGEQLLLRAGVGWKPGLVGTATVGAGADSQAGYTLAARDPVIVEDLRIETRFSGPPLLCDHSVVSGMSVTIPGGDRPWGVLGAHTASPRRFSRDDIHFLQAVSNVLATAIERQRAEDERAAILAREQEARALAEAAGKRAGFLAKASAILNSSLDYATTLSSVARLAVPDMADWCVIDVAQADGTLKRVRAAHVDPGKEQLAMDLYRRYPPDPEASQGPLQVVRTGEPEIVSEIGEPLIEASARDPEHLAILRALGLKSYMCVPLLARGRVLGAITFIAAESGRRYAHEDLALAEDLAQRCGLAVDNAMLYQEAEREIVRRTQTEELLAAEKERLAVTLESIGDGVITTDTEGRVVLMNNVAQDLTGWELEQAAGRKLEEVFYIINERTRAPCESPVVKVMATGAVVGLANHTALIARDGTERVIADSGAPIRDRGGRILGVVLVFRDVTEKQRLEDELLNAQKLESIGILAGGIAHDFNNILTAILGNIALAKLYSRPGDKVSEVLSEAERAFARARDLTQQLLTFSKGGAPIKKTAAITDLLEETAVFALRGSNVRVEFSIEDSLRPVKFDAGQMSQVINNLVINAMQAMPEGGTVHIEARNSRVDGAKSPPLLPRGNYVRLRIKDEGIGIPEEHLGKIFDPYFTTKQTGSGLGLATTRSIIKKHDGFVYVDSKPGAGTTFTIYLPASEEQAEEAAVKPEQTFRGEGRVLLMDDEETIRRVASALLVRLGYRVDVAQDGDEAMRMYVRALEADEPYLAVIMDLTIPGAMGGKELVQKLKEIDPGVRAIVSSGYSNDPVMAEYAKYGFSGVVAKPYQLRDLGETLHRVAGGEPAVD